jgi:hypothetical protein
MRWIEPARYGQIREEFGPDLLREIRLAFEGAENRVNENRGVGMRHLCRPSGARRHYGALDPAALAVG